MKWPGEDPNLINLNSQQDAHGHNPPRTQDDAMIGYVFQRGVGEQPEFQPNNVPLPGKLPARWTLGNEELVQQQQQSQHPNQEQMIYMNSEMAMMTQHHHPGLPLPPPHMQPRPIAPSAKKLWGVEEQRDDKGLLHLSDHQMWRDSTWSIIDHAVSQPISMVPRRSGSYPGSDTANMLSPRSSDTGGLGVKMVEYVLATSPTSKDQLESRMRNLVLNSTDGDKKEKELSENSSSPYEPKKDDVNGNGGQTNGHASNGLADDEKTFNRTPGSRQPSPAEEEINKNNGGTMTFQPAAIMAQKAAQMEHLHMMRHMNGLHPVLALQAHHHQQQQQTLQNGNLPGPPPPPPPVPPPHESINQHFEHAVHAATLEHNFDPSSYASGIGNGTPTVLAGASGGMDSPGVLPQNLDIQQLFRNQQQQQQQQQQPQQSGTSQPIHVLQQQQQQQYLQQQAAAAQQQQLAFNTAPYVINTQEPYILAAGPTVLPQYYGVAPWGVYPASIIQQNATGQQRRPLSPGSAAAAAAAAAASSETTNLTQGQYIIPYYDQNGSIVMGNVRGIGNTAPMRLVSPAPVLVNAAAATTGNNMRLLGNQPQQIATPPGAASLYNNNQPSLYSSTTTANGNLGLSSTSGRRDSFDRNISAFSPSLDYNRGKWNTNYGALGTVTAAPSPLGLTGSLTPPPSIAATLGSSTNLQLGTLMSSRVLSAAPGAEAVAKYRNGLTTAAMFSSSSSLLTKLTAAASRPRGMEKPAARSRLLEDFRNNRFPSLSLRDLSCHIVEFSQDQHGSRFIQQKLERATVNEKQMVFKEILPSAYNLMTDVFGNYVIQKFFEFGTPEQKATLAQKVRGHVLLLALQMYGCRVIQKALESVTSEQQQEIVRELDGHVLKCVKDQNGNHVVQKCIECVDPHALQFIINAFSGQVFALSTHPYGCRVIQRILEHCTPEQTASILEELHSHAEQLVQDQYGNYVIQHVLEHGKPEDKSKIISNVRGKVLALSQHKFASNVVEKCVTHATRTERTVLIEEVCNYNDNALQLMMRDQYANYVVQKMIDVCEHTQRKILMHKIRGHISALRKYTYGKHIIAKLDKFFMKTPTLPSVGSELL